MAKLAESLGSALHVGVQRAAGLGEFAGARRLLQRGLHGSAGEPNRFSVTLQQSPFQTIKP
jgi:hypothetical protein